MAHFAPQLALMAVVKADAYGHGLLPVAHAALDAGARWLGTATVEEAIAVRADGISAAPRQSAAVFGGRVFPLAQ